MASTYISCFDYALSPSGLEYTSLVANMTRVGGTGVLVGATTLPILTPGLSTPLNAYDHVTIFDGANSEVVALSAGAISGATTLLCSAMQFAHSVGTPLCSDGIMGSLAASILSSGQTLETICRQSLFQATYTNELLTMPSMRGSIDNHAILHFRPRHWPIDSLSSISITTVPNNTIPYDPTQVVIDSDKQICIMPNMQPLTSSGVGIGQAYPVWNTTSRYQSAQLQITYLAGYNSIPLDITEAAILLTSDVIAKRLNPIGAPDLGSGARHISAVLRGDLLGESLLRKRAQNILDNYTMQSF